MREIGLFACLLLLAISACAAGPDEPEATLDADEGALKLNIYATQVGAVFFDDAFTSAYCATQALPCTGELRRYRQVRPWSQCTTYKYVEVDLAKVNGALRVTKLYRSDWRESNVEDCRVR